MSSRLRTLAAVTTTCLLVLTGCGGSATPAEKVPELADALTAVDDALDSKRYRPARRHLQDLVAAAEEARATGALAEDEADRVLAAAARLLAALPAAPDGQQSPGTAPETGPRDGGEKSGGEEAKKLKEERKKLEEERKKLEEKKQTEGDEGSGNGESSDNGPDDGHGD